MGFNKVLLLLNDREHDVNTNPTGWWEDCKSAFYRLSRRPLPKTDAENALAAIRAGSFWGGQAICEHHADNVSVIIAGGNYATVVGTVYNGGRGHHELDDQLSIFKRVLEEKGYTITKKRQKKT